MRLRLAQVSDVVLLRRWDAQPHVIAALGADGGLDHDWESEIARRADWGEWLIAEADDGCPIGVMQVIDPAREESRYWGEVPAGLRAVDIWLGEARDLGRGYGTDMMRLVLARCFTDPTVTAVLVDPLVANVRSHRFYERLGFRLIERRLFGEDDCYVYRLDRAAWRDGD